MPNEAAEDILHQLPLLSFLPPDVRRLVCDSFVPMSFSFGTEIVREGEPAEAFYVLLEGRARILKRGQNGDELSLMTLKPGDTFGEMGLLGPAVRTVTVRASSEVRALRLERAVFEAMLRHRPELRQYFELQIRHRHLHAFFREFTAFAQLPPEALAELLGDLEPVEAMPGEAIVREGDPPGPMFIVEEGRCRVHIGDNGRRRNLAYLRRGEYFGELSVFRDQPRSATVEALTPCRLLRLTQATFTDLLQRYPAFRDEIEAHIAQYDYRHTAQIPLDFAEELLPAEASVQEKVGAEQVDGEPESAEWDREPFADQEGRFRQRPGKIRRMPHVWQLDEMDCGAASLAIVCRFFGRTVSLARIRQLVHTSLDGTSLRAICQGADELGLAARSIKASPQHLDRMPLPAIVHWEGNHWVVLYEVSPTHVRISDPGTGRRRIARTEFEEKWTGYGVLFEATPRFALNRHERPGVGWLFSFFRPYHAIILQAVALALIGSGLQMVAPVFTQVIVDRVLVEHDAALLHILITAMVIVVGLTLVAGVVERYLLSFTAVRIDSATLDFLTRRLLSLPMRYFSTRRTGDIQRRLAGIWMVREFLVERGVAALTAVAQLVASLGLMLVYSPVLTLTFLATVPVFIILMRFASVWLFPLYAELEASHGKYQSFQIDAIKGIETVKALGAELSFRNLMLNEFNRVARGRFKADFTLMSYHSLINAVTLISVALFLLVGSHQVMSGRLSIGALVAFNALVALANAPITTLLMLWDNLQQVTVYLNRLDDVLQQEPEQGEDRSRLIPVKSLEGRLTLRKLTFRYGGPEAPAILDDISLEVMPNTMVAIVGRSGSGKTTLIKCLAGLLEPTEGTILYDGVELKTLNYRDLRRQIGFVLQENHLFDDSIARNIAFGEEEPDLDKVMWAAQAANAREFIERLPLGYDTRIGESGISLSGGQRQRIAIARAIYHRPPVLIFDEATSALDTESEKAVKENLDRLLEGRTSFVIAHRLSTVRDADLIIVLEKGRLVEQGTHDELMERQGLYYFLVSQQLGL